MNYKLLQIFRNTPFGRETFLQSLYFCKTIHAHPVVYIPESDKFLMYFPNDAIQIDLDSSYLASPKTAKQHASELFEEMGFKPAFFAPRSFTASTLPDIPINFDYFCCPRSVSDLSSKIGLGHIGPKVRRIIKQAPFPVLLTSLVFKPWKSIAVFFGGSTNARKALQMGLKMAMVSKLPMDIYTLREKKSKGYYENIIKESDLAAPVSQFLRNWHYYEKSEFDAMLYDVPHDALMVLGAYGHGVIKDLLFGSKMEKIQSTVTNNLLITGPRCELSLLH